MCMVSLVHTQSDKTTDHALLYLIGRRESRNFWMLTCSRAVCMHFIVCTLLHMVQFANCSEVPILLSKFCGVCLTPHLNIIESHLKYINCSQYIFLLIHYQGNFF